MNENTETLGVTYEYENNIECFNECLNNTKDATDIEIEKIYKECGCDINCISESSQFSYEDDKYEIISCFIINGGEGQGEDYEEISKIIEKENSNVYFVSFDSYYDSWDGNNYDDSIWSVVKPVKRITIEFIGNK